MADELFDFETEFALLDVGATTSFLRTRSVRPTVVGFNSATGIESVALEWPDGVDYAAPFEEARRYLRDMGSVAYAIVAMAQRQGGQLRYISQDRALMEPATLAISMFAGPDTARSAVYPVRQSGPSAALGVPIVADGNDVEWSPIGDLWSNPFCAGDVVQFKPRERAIDPATPLWSRLVDLTRMRIQADQPRADDYLMFLDDLRNGIFIVDGRSSDAPDCVLLRPRTVFNPIGVLEIMATRLDLVASDEPGIDKVVTA